MQQARHVWTRVGYFGVVTQSLAGGQERAPEVVQGPAAAVREKRERRGRNGVWVRCMG
jgi:hypothetical protein